MNTVKTSWQNNLKQRGVTALTSIMLSVMPFGLVVPNGTGSAMLTTISEQTPSVASSIVIPTAVYPTKAPSPTPKAYRPPKPAKYAESGQALLECIKRIESGGNYGAVNAAGYYGAYQFAQGTWNSTASASGRSDLVGVNPASASPADQDAMALALIALRGLQPWPTPNKVCQ